jgi:predicted GNAT family N-acyltransferase
MRLAEAKDTDDLVSLYQEAASHAHAVGMIDWPNSIPKAFVDDLVASDELYCFGQEQILGAARLSQQGDTKIWEDESLTALYLAKLATGNQTRGQNYFKNVMLPAIIEHAGSNTRLRLDCLADNARLQDFYRNLGFVSLGNVEFFSDKQQRELVVTRFER